MTGWINQARREFHAELIENLISVSNEGVPSNADRSSKPSIKIATGILKELGSIKTSEKLPGQTAGANFEIICAAFLKTAFLNYTIYVQENL